MRHGLRTGGVLAVLVALAVSILPSPTPAQTSGSRGRPDAPGATDTRGREPAPEEVQAVRGRAEAQGRARALVLLKDRFMPEGSLDGPGRNAQRQRFREQREALLADLRGTDFRQVRAYETLPVVALELSPAALDAALRSGRVAAVTEDVPDQPTLDSTGPIVGAPVAWSAGFDGAGQMVAVLDTGVDAAHPFLGGRVVEEACFTDEDCPGGGATETGPGSAQPCGDEDCDHGTHVAGIAAGEGPDFDGMARAAEVFAVQVFTVTNGSAGSYPSDQLAALEHVLLRATDSGGPLDLAAVNMSIGGSKKNTSPCDGDVRKLAIDNLRSEGIPTVISSGNQGYSDGLTTPACISTAISVGATTDSDIEASFSNAASFLSLLAPGVSVRSSVPGNGFATLSGTSMAAPHVAGAWTVLSQAAPSATVDQVLEALQATGQRVKLGGGLNKRRIDIGAALAQLGTPSTTATTSSSTSTLSTTTTSTAGGGSACAASGNATITEPGVVTGSGVFGATGDCIKVVGGGGADRITVGSHAGTTKVASGGGDDRICAQNGSSDVIKGGDGKDQALVDGGDTLESATSVSALDCTGETGPGPTTTTVTTSTTVPDVTTTTTVTTSTTVPDVTTTTIPSSTCAATGNATVTQPGVVVGSGVFGATGDCSSVSSSGGTDLITVGPHAGTTKISSGGGEDRICAQNGSVDVIRGGDGKDQALVDGGDTLESATAVTALDCAA